MKNIFTQQLSAHLETMNAVNVLFPEIEKAAHYMIDALNNGHKVLLCGNGGSAADSQHIAAEIVGRFETERAALPAMALTTDTSILTAVGNDYGYAYIFSRQVEGLANEGDVLIAYSTSGNSENIINAAQVAVNKGCKVIAFSGRDGGKLALLADANLCVNVESTARIQEAHAFIGHFLCSQIDAAYQ